MLKKQLVRNRPPNQRMQTRTYNSPSSDNYRTSSGIGNPERIPSPIAIGQARDFQQRTLRLRSGTGYPEPTTDNRQLKIDNIGHANRIGHDIKVLQQLFFRSVCCSFSNYCVHVALL
ncbi:MAG: hypothetical protein RLZZ630_419 [Bacteroidota bacterium]